MGRQVGRRVGRRVGRQGGSSGWVARAGRQGGSQGWVGGPRPTPDNRQTHRQTDTVPQPNPLSQRTQGSKYAARAPPHSDIYIYIYIYIYIQRE